VCRVRSVGEKQEAVAKIAPGVGRPSRQEPTGVALLGDDGSEG
jgi:hypothetical protein